MSAVIVEFPRRFREEMDCRWMTGTFKRLRRLPANKTLTNEQVWHAAQSEWQEYFGDPPTQGIERLTELKAERARMEREEDRRKLERLAQLIAAEIEKAPGRSGAGSEANGRDGAA